MTAPQGAPLLRIEGLRSWFDGPAGVVRAVDGVSLRVHEGERVGIVGESGSGKTQSFFGVFGLSHGRPGVIGGVAEFAGTDLLGGVERFVRGFGDSDDVPGKDVAGWNREHKRRLRGVLGTDVAVLFQDPRRSLVPYWTVARHLEAALQNRGGDREQARRESPALLSQLGFDDPARILRSLPGQLSGGEAQRAMLALTMAIRPRLLVADEPTTGLDAINQVTVLHELRKAQEQAGFALVLISHDLAVVEGLVDYIFVMFAGRVVEAGPAAMLGSQEEGFGHPYTAELRESQRRRLAGLPIVGQDPVINRGPSKVGCPFRTRCVLHPTLDATRQRRCEREAPVLAAVGTRRTVACWGGSS